MSEGYKETEGKIDYSEIYWNFITAMSNRMEVNKVKYLKHNYRKPIDDKDQLLQAALRHLIKIIEPVENDPESLDEHAASIACNMMMYYYQIKHFK